MTNVSTQDSISSTNQKRKFYTYLRKYTATASMAAKATGIKQKNLCRYKRQLEKEGLLWQVEEKICQETGFRAWYLTTDPAKATKKSN